MERTVRFRWLGVAGVELVAGGTTLLIDPFLTRPPLRCLWLGRPTSDAALVERHIRQADAVLVTHAHWDHLMDVPEVVRQTGAMAYGSRNTGMLLRALGVSPERVRLLEAGDRLTVGPFDVGVLSAEHVRILGRRVLVGAIASTMANPPRLRDYRMDSDFSFLIESQGMRLLVWSSEAADGARPADVLFVKPFASQHPAFAELLRVVRPQVVVPIHWDDFFRSLSRPLRPSFGPPAWRWPPLRRVDLGTLRETTEHVLPDARVFVPEIFHTYDVRKTRTIRMPQRA